MRIDGWMALTILALLSTAALLPLLAAAEPLGLRTAAQQALAKAIAQAHVTVASSTGMQTVPADLSPPLDEIGRASCRERV